LSESENEVIICGIVEGIELGSTRRRKDKKNLAAIEFSDLYLMKVKRLDERRVAYMVPKRV